MEDRFKTFTILIAKITRCIRKIKTEEMAEFKLKSPHVSCLYYLYKESGMTAKELCDVCDEDKAAISRSIEYLEDNSFIYCESKFEKRYKWSKSSKSAKLSACLLFSSVSFWARVAVKSIASCS